MTGPPRCSPSCHGETVTAPVQRRQDPPMRRYEMMIILDPGLEENTIQPSLDQFLTVVRDGGGSVDKVDVWGRRRLAYDIDKKSEGIYAVIDMVAEPDTVRELDRQLGLNEAVLRTKVLRPKLPVSEAHGSSAARAPEPPPDRWQERRVRKCDRS